MLKVKPKNIINRFRTINKTKVDKYEEVKFNDLMEISNFKSIYFKGKN